MKKGISLIVLIITIIVVIILVGAVILNLSNINIIEEANNAVSLSNAKSNEEAFTLYKASLFIENKGKLDSSNFSIEGENLVYDTNGDGEITPNIIKPLDEIFSKPEIIESVDIYGKLIQTNDSNSESTEGPAEEPTVITVDTDTAIFRENRTLDGNAATSENPIVPKGFKPVNATNNAGSVVANWNDLTNNYNKGLVIQDNIGNQFVWIPVDRLGTPGEMTAGEVTYNKWTTDGNIYNKSNISDGTFLGGLDETVQITNYGGFYVGRYEAGKEEADVLVSKYDAAVWNYITYPDAITLAESMYTNSNTYGVKSALLTGTMWDTMLDYLIEYGGKTSSEVDGDSKSWGNYRNYNGPTVSGYIAETLYNAGYSDYWQAGNIYDIAGNTKEFTNENYDDKKVYRGGYYAYDGARSSSYRYYGSSTTNYSHLSFRVALYIQS